MTMTGMYGGQAWQQHGQPVKYEKCALTLVLVAMVAACGTASPSGAAVGSFGSLDVVSRGDGRVLPTYPKDGRQWVVGTPGQEYSVRVCNSTGGRLLTVISVDGVNVITGDTAAPSQSGYVLSPYECADIGGWRKSMTHTAAFYFTELPDAYAARTGRPENVGVIGVALFPEKPQRVAWKAQSGSVQGEIRADAPATRQEADAGTNAQRRAREDVGSARDEVTAPAAAPQAKIGTGHGRAEDSPTQMVRFERASPTPAETLAIHYDRRENLVAMGVLPPPVAARVPNPFPAWTARFVPNPPPR
jgi:hypothetical protein